MAQAAPWTTVQARFGAFWMDQTAGGAGAGHFGPSLVVAKQHCRESWWGVAWLYQGGAAVHGNEGQVLLLSVD